jgi:hypothetical protein
MIVIDESERGVGGANHRPYQFQGNIPLFPGNY